MTTRCWGAVAWALVVACSSDPPAPLPLVDQPIDRTGASAVIDLAALEGTYELPMSNRPGGQPLPAEMTLQVTDVAPDGHAELALPFETSKAANRFAPRGMRVLVGAEELDYHTGRLGPRAHGWTITGGVLFVRPTAPLSAGDGVTVVHPELAKRVAAYDLSTSGKPAFEHVQRKVTFQDETRPGLMIAAPGAASWTVTVPAGGHLDTAVAMMQAPLPGATSDGATAIVSVVAGGETHEVDRRAVPGAVERFEPWSVDLSAWAGREVTVRLSTEPGATPDHDYVFFASPEISGSPQGDVRRVVVVGLDTTRRSHLGVYGYGRDTTPELNAWAERAVVFDRAWTPAPRTRPSFRTATTGRNPLDAVGATNIGEVFAAHDFATAAFVANVHLHPRFGFDRGFDVWHLDTAAKVDDQVDAALGWLREHKDRDTYLFLHIMDPHLFYVPPRSYAARFPVEHDPDLPSRFGRGDVYTWMRKGELDDRRKEQIKALYDGEVAFTSAELGRFLHELDALGGANLVVIHNDHGEEFWEHGAYEHNHSLYDETVGGVLMIRPPGGRGARTDVPATLADIAPTLFDYAGFTDVPPTDGVSLRPFVDGTAAQDDARWSRPLPVGYLRYGHERWGVVANQHKYILHTGSGDEELYDLRADPGEQQDLAKGADLAPYRKALALAHSLPVGPGWRVKVRLKGSEPLVWTLPQPALAAGVIDPESLTEHPVNQAWGEVPPVTRADVARVELSEDRATLTVTPGPKGVGTLYVLFGDDVAPGGTLARGDAAPVTVEKAARAPNARVALGQTTLDVRPGVVLVQPASEADRMAGVAGVGDATGDELELLQALGYVDP